MLIDHFMPHCDFYERHTTVIRATPEQVYAALRTADLGRSPIARALLAIRGMGRTSKRTFGLDTFRREGFHVIAEDPPAEMVIGLEGPFWRPNCVLRDVDATTFATPVTGNAARAAWNFFIEREAAGATRLSTETRVLCSDDARTKFRMYWAVVRPFSGLIRRLMLRAIRREAERDAIRLSR